MPTLVPEKAAFQKSPALVQLGGVSVVRTAFVGEHVTHEFASDDDEPLESHEFQQLLLRRLDAISRAQASMQATVRDALDNLQHMLAATSAGCPVPLVPESAPWQGGEVLNEAPAGLKSSLKVSLDEAPMGLKSSLRFSSGKESVLIDDFASATENKRSGKKGVSLDLSGNDSWPPPADPAPEEAPPAVSFWPELRNAAFQSVERPEGDQFPIRPEEERSVDDVCVCEAARCSNIDKRNSESSCIDDKRNSGSSLKDEGLERTSKASGKPRRSTFFASFKSLGSENSESSSLQPQASERASKASGRSRRSMFASLRRVTQQSVRNATQSVRRSTVKGIGNVKNSMFHAMGAGRVTRGTKHAPRGTGYRLTAFGGKVGRNTGFRRTGRDTGFQMAVDFAEKPCATFSEDASIIGAAEFVKVEPRYKLLPNWVTLKEAWAKAMDDSDSDVSDVSTHLPRNAVWAGPNAIQIAPSLPRKRCSIDNLERMIISPWSTQRTLWDILGMSLICYDAINVPLQVFEIGENTFGNVMAMLLMLFWTADIAVSFFTGYNDAEKNKCETKPIKVFWHYIRTWFFFDVVAVSPDWIAITYGDRIAADMTGVGRTVRTLRLLRSLRLLRLVKLRHLLVSIEKRFNNDYLICNLNLLKLMICLGVLNHFLACGWYAISDEEEELGWASGPNYNSTDVGYLYLTSVHWSLTQFQGSMEVFPRTIPERAYAVLVLYLGVIVAAGFISCITNSMTRIQQIYGEKLNRRWILLRFLNEHHISGELSVRVKEFSDRAISKERTKAEKVELLDMLPENLRMELEYEVKSHSFALHPLLFYLTDGDLILGKRMALGIGDICMDKGDRIYDKDQFCDRLYILVTGALAYTTEDLATKSESTGAASSTRKTLVNMLRRTAGGVNNPALPNTRLRPLEPGDVMCEMAWWTAWLHRGTCMADVCSEVYQLKSSTFEEIVSKDKNHSMRVLRYGGNFLAWMNHQADGFLDDLSTPVQRDD